MHSALEQRCNAKTITTQKKQDLGANISSILHNFSIKIRQTTKSHIGNFKFRKTETLSRHKKCKHVTHAAFP